MLSERTPRTAGPRILVVDDEPESCRFRQTGVEEAGYPVELAASGEEALDKAGRIAPDAVILDLLLPDMSGLDLFQQLREWSPPPILFVSATTDARTKV